MTRPLFLPGRSMLDVRLAIQTGHIGSHTKEVVLAENNRELADHIQAAIPSLPFASRYRLFRGNVEDMSVTKPFDFVFLDLIGYLSPPLIRWIEELPLMPGATFCLNLTLRARNSPMYRIASRILAEDPVASLFRDQLGCQIAARKSSVVNAASLLYWALAPRTAQAIRWTSYSELRRTMLLMKAVDINDTSTDKPFVLDPALTATHDQANLPLLSSTTDTQATGLDGTEAFMFRNIPADITAALEQAIDGLSHDRKVKARRALVAAARFGAQSTAIVSRGTAPYERTTTPQQASHDESNPNRRRILAYAARRRSFTADQLHQHMASHLVPRPSVSATLATLVRDATILKNLDGSYSLAAKLASS